MPLTSNSSGLYHLYRVTWNHGLQWMNSGPAESIDRMLDPSRSYFDGVALNALYALVNGDDGSVTHYRVRTETIVRLVPVNP